LAFVLLMSSQLSGDALASQASGSSEAPAISASGRYVAFESVAADLVSGDTNARRDVFVRDGEDRTTERMSGGSGGAQANGDSYGASISDDGRYVAFTSQASNLVSGDTNGAADVFVYDRSTKTIDRVSVSESGGQLSAGGEDPAVSGDGRYVAYVTRSSATPSASSCAHSDNGVEDVYVYDRSARKTIYQVSAWRWSDDMGVCDTTGGGVGVGGETYSVGGNGRSVNPAISASGDYVAFETDATDLGGSSDTNGVRDVYVRAGSTSDRSQRVSIAASGEQANGSSTQASISDDGRHVAFQALWPSM
jgi:Tol biopolymer transport system component